MNENVYVKLSEHEISCLEEISKITMTDYKINGDFISVDSLIVALEDLLCEYDSLDEEYSDYKTKDEDSEYFEYLHQTMQDRKLEDYFK